MKEYVVNERIGQITDFFERCEYAAERKCRLLRQSPYLLDFVVRAFYSQREAVSEDINQRVSAEMAAIFGTYFNNVDFSKFREDTDPKEIYRMLTWMADGYLHERRRTGLSVGLDDMMEQYRLWSAYFRRMSYKEEYLK